jgi:hypothetical protein
MLTLLVATVAAQAPQRPPGDVPRSQSVPNTGVITGVVKAAETGVPLRGADVRLTGADFSTALGNGIRGAFTDANGRYEFRGLAEGQYTLVASKVRYVSTTFGQARAGERGTPVKLVNGQRVQNIDIALPAGAVIVVRLNDRFGDPAVGYSVNLHLATAGKRPLSQPPVSSYGSTTDDRGEIRLSGLAPGEYFVSAEGGRYLISPAAVPGQQEVLTFYPGTDSDVDAQPVTVGPGDEVVAAFSMVSRLVSPATTN